MKRMYIVRGLPGSGKSTLALELLDDIWPAAILSSDEYFTIGGEYYFDVMKLGSAHRWNQWRSRQLLAAGVNLIIDNTNTTWKEIKSYAENGVKAGYEVVVREPTTEWAKDIEGLFKNGTHSVPKDTLIKMLARWESTESIEKKIRGYNNVFIC